MKIKKILLLTVFLSVLMFSKTVFSHSNADSAVFINAETNEAIDEIATAKKVMAKLHFSAKKEGKINIITARYDDFGRITSDLIFETVTITSENKDCVVHTTEPVFTENVFTIKVFAWEAENLTPALEHNGVLNRVFECGEAFSQKLELIDAGDENTPYVAVKGQPVLVSDIFGAADGVEINSEFFNISVKVPSENATDIDFKKDISDWTKSTLTFNSEGLIKISASDYDFCIPREACINVIEAVDRYYTKFENTGDYIYRVGNRNNVSLSSLFEEKGTDIPVSDTNVEITTLQGTAQGTFTPHISSWEKGTIKFSGTGVVRLTIKDDYSKEYSLLLEVIDAKNITAAEDAKLYDVVLLNDINGSFTVLDGHTFFGNGFEVTLPTDYIQSTSMGYSGYIKLGSTSDNGQGTGGNLDNVKITGPVYPEMNIYRSDAEIKDSTDPEYGSGNNTRYFKNSVMVYGGKCTISNCYISGSRAAVSMKANNDILIENTTVSGGAYANIEICSGEDITFRNLTTIQNSVNDSYGKDTQAHGLGVVIDSNEADIYIEGELRQNNWFNQEEWEDKIPTTLQSSFPKVFTDERYADCWHNLNGSDTKYVNMTFIYRCDWDINKIHDNRENINYSTYNATIGNIKGGIYTKANTLGESEITQSDLSVITYRASGFNPARPVFVFDNAQNNDYDDENDLYDSYCVYSDNKLKIGLTEESENLKLSGATVKHYGLDIPYTVELNGKELSNDSVDVKFEDGKDQVLTFRASVEKPGFDALGNKTGTKTDYIWEIPIELTKISYPAPVWNMGETYKFNCDNCYYAYYTQNQGYGEAVPIYEGIKVLYYNEKGQEVNLDLSGTTAIPSGINNQNDNEFSYTLSDGSKLTMKYVGGWKGTSHEFTTYKEKVYIYPQSLDNDNYVRAKRTNQDFNMKISYTFTDSNGGKTPEVTMNWYNPKSSNEDIATVQWKEFDSTNGKTTSCVTADTLITLADGSCKRIDEVTYSDKLLVWDFYKGEYAESSPAILFNHGFDYNTVIKLTFDDSSQIKVVNLHQFFDSDLNRFVTIDKDSVSDYLNHSFMKRDGDGYKKLKLISYEISEGYVEAYGVISAVHYNILVCDLFSTDFMPNDYGLFNYFEVGENMVFDEDQLLKDIETYGLYSYEDFSSYLTYEQFEAFNIKYMKIAVGKGYYTFEGILNLIKKYLYDN